MQKIDRFRYIDDSASSTTTVTSPVESIEQAHARRPCNHLLTSAIEQFDDYVRSQYPDENNDEINSLIDRLDSDMLLNGSYSDLNILNRAAAQQGFKPVNHPALQSTRVGICS